MVSKSGTNYLNPKEIFSTSDIATLLDVTPETVRRWIRNGELSYLRRGQSYQVSGYQLARFAKDYPERVDGKVAPANVIFVGKTDGVRYEEIKNSKITKEEARSYWQLNSTNRYLKGIVSIRSEAVAGPDGLQRDKFEEALLYELRGLYTDMMALCDEINAQGREENQGVAESQEETD